MTEQPTYTENAPDFTVYERAQKTFFDYEDQFLSIALKGPKSPKKKHRKKYKKLLQAKREMAKTHKSTANSVKSDMLAALLPPVKLTAWQIILPPIDYQHRTRSFTLVCRCEVGPFTWYMSSNTISTAIVDGMIYLTSLDLAMDRIRAGIYHSCGIWFKMEADQESFGRAEEVIKSDRQNEAVMLGQ